MGLLAKRQSELDCPTDVRQSIHWLAGEDAVFCCPCGPSADFYGHKPTCWQEWPVPSTTWRDAYCCPGPVVIYPSTEALSPGTESGHQFELPTPGGVETRSVLPGSDPSPQNSIAPETGAVNLPALPQSRLQDPRLVMGNVPDFAY
jgi:hypothetical protein